MCALGRGEDEQTYNTGDEKRDCGRLGCGVWRSGLGPDAHGEWKRERVVGTAVDLHAVRRIWLKFCELIVIGTALVTEQIESVNKVEEIYRPQVDGAESIGAYGDSAWSYIC